MAKPWIEVVSSDAFGRLTPEQQSTVKQQYFDAVIAANLPAAEHDAAWAQFSSAPDHVTEIESPTEPPVTDKSTGVNGPEIETVEHQEPEVIEMAGEPINEEWTSFSPESGTIGVPRAVMPQIKSVYRGALVNFLKARGIDCEADEVPADSLMPTQAEFSPTKVAQAMAFTGKDRSILVSADGHVLDGHHQWLSKLETQDPVKVIKLGAPISVLLPTVKDFPSLSKPEQREPSSEAKLQAFESLISGISGALADLVDVAKEGRAPIDEIASGMADLVATLEKRREQPMDALVTAIKGLRIEAKVNVNPTPITVEAVLPPAPAPVIHFLPDPNAKGATWEVTVPGKYGAADRVMTIRRTK